MCCKRLQGVYVYLQYKVRILVIKKIKNLKGIRDQYIHMLQKVRNKLKIVTADHDHEMRLIYGKKVRKQIKYITFAGYLLKSFSMLI